ncbi:MAG TPA: M24 family metallopeptidase [Opitutales bacterium]|nr:M24 family metallopeptidase [Opitutales bacterium]
MSELRAVYASTDQSSDALYLSRTHIPDAFLALDCDGRRIGVFSALEFGRMLAGGAFQSVLQLEDLVLTVKKLYGANPGPGDILAVLARQLGFERVKVGPEFPAIVLRQAEGRGLKLDVSETPLFPERQVKDDSEIAQLRLGNQAAAAGFAEVAAMLAAARVRPGGALELAGEPLTSERVRSAINVACLKKGGWAMNTIVAGGDQACDPHCEGSGILRAGELIVVDIFPRLEASGYFGDMTRTFLKGSPSARQRDLVETVAAGQKLALSQIRDGADGRAIHMAVTEFFDSKGYHTERGKDRSVGFFHGLGHCVGLDIHEAPRMNRTGAPLKNGNVITVEPGLYFPGLGGCRIEDVVVVREAGCEMISSHPYDWVVA